MKPIAMKGQQGEDGLGSGEAKPRRGRPTFQCLFNGAVCVVFVFLIFACAGLYCRVCDMQRELQGIRARTELQDAAATDRGATGTSPDGSSHLRQENNNRQAHSVRKRDAEEDPTEKPKRKRHERAQGRRKGKKKCPRNCKGEKGDVGPTGAQGPPGPSGNFTSTFAHFKSKGGLTKLKLDTLNDWVLADWADAENFQVASTGEITVEKPGIYFIYSQVTFREKQHLVAYRVLIDGSPYMTCNESVENVTTEDDWRYKTCYVAGLARLEARSRIEITLGGENMSVMLFFDTTYLGLIKVADLPPV